MIDSLYDIFKHWSKNGSVYIISDPHFEDDDCLYMNPNWISAEEHLRIINEKVHKNDTLICLGDCGNLEYISKIKAGYKILIKGNHDDRGDNYYKRKIIYKDISDNVQLTKAEIREQYQNKYPGSNIQITKTDIIVDNKLFDEVYDGQLFISDKILISHEPVYGLQFCVNLHGHVHNGEYVYTDSLGGKHYNFASDVVGWQVYSLKDLINSGLVSNIKSLHRLTIDNASNRSPA